MRDMLELSRYDFIPLWPRHSYHAKSSIFLPVLCCKAYLGGPPALIYGFRSGREDRQKRVVWEHSRPWVSSL